MTLSTLWDSLLYILRKESKGLAVSPDGFSDLLQVKNLSLFNEYYKVFEVNQVTTDALRAFKDVAQLDLSYDGESFSQYVALPSDYKHITGLQVGAAAVSFTWTDDPNDVSFSSPDTFASTGTNITSYISALNPAEATSSTISLTADTDYVLKIDVTDESVSPESDMPSVYLLIEGTLDEQTTMTEGLNFINFNSGAVTGQINIIVRKESAEAVDISADFTLTLDDSEFVEIDRVTDEEWVNRRNDELTKPTATYPIARISADNIYVAPKSIDNIILFYLTTPATPFFDYYFDANLVIQAMDEDDTHVLTTGEVGRSGEAAGATVTSATVELEWEDIDQIKILHRILAKLGVSMDEQLVAQYALSQANS